MVKCIVRSGFQTLQMCLYLYRQLKAFPFSTLTRDEPLPQSILITLTHTHTQRPLFNLLKNNSPGFGWLKYYICNPSSIKCLFAFAKEVSLIRSRTHIFQSFVACHYHHTHLWPNFTMFCLRESTQGMIRSENHYCSIVKTGFMFNLLMEFVFAHDLMGWPRVHNRVRLPTHDTGGVHAHKSHE